MQYSAFKINIVIGLHFDNKVCNIIQCKRYTLYIIFHVRLNQSYGFYLSGMLHNEGSRQYFRPGRLNYIAPESRYFKVFLLLPISSPCGDALTLRGPFLNMWVNSNTSTQKKITRVVRGVVVKSTRSNLKIK